MILLNVHLYTLYEYDYFTDFKVYKPSWIKTISIELGTFSKALMYLFCAYATFL